MPVSHSYRKTFQPFLGVSEAICLQYTHGKDSKIAHPSSLGDSSWDRRSPAGQRDLLRTPHTLISLAERETDPVRIQYYFAMEQTNLDDLCLRPKQTEILLNVWRGKDVTGLYI